MNSANVLKEQAYQCGNLSCRHPVDSSTAHIVNVVSDADSKPGNFIALCSQCNRDFASDAITRMHLQAWRLVYIGINVSDYPDPDKLRSYIYSRFKDIYQYLPDRIMPYIVHGRMCNLNIRESPMMFARVLGMYEPFKTRYIRENLDSGAVFIDVGANKGDFSLLASDIAGTEGHVIAIEPEHENALNIRSSISLNGITNIEIHECALSESSGEAQLFLGNKSGWHSLKNVDGRGEKGSVVVPVTTLDELVRSSGFAVVDMVKIDVEGAEIEVLRGGSHVLETVRPGHIIIDVHQHMGVDAGEIVRMFDSSGYDIYDLATGAAIEYIKDDVNEIVARPA